MNTSMIIVFIHYYKPEYLRYACYQSLSMGYDTLVIGDDMAKQVKHVDFIPVTNFDGAVSKFLQVYRHRSINSENYELKCLTRWFILLDYMRRIGSNTKIILTDSDVLVFRGLPNVVNLLNGRSMLDTAWLNCITSVDTLSSFCEFLIKIYTDDSELEALSRKYSVDGKPHLSDMHLLWEFADRFPDLVSAVRHSCHLFGFDNSLRLTNDFSELNGVKRIGRSNGYPFGIVEKTGQPIEFSTLHFQGLTKPLMECYHLISNENYLNELKTLGQDWWANLNYKSDALAQSVKGLYNEFIHDEKNMIRG